MSTARHHMPRRVPEPAHVPTRQEAKASARAKIGLPHAVLDKGDLGTMHAITSDLGDAATTDKQRELVAELNSFLAFLRMQLP